MGFRLVSSLPSRNYFLEIVVKTYPKAYIIIIIMIINIIVININITLFQSIQSYSGNKHKIKVQKITVKPQYKSGNSKNMFKEKDFFFLKIRGQFLYSKARFV